MANIIKTIYGRLLDWSGLANVPAALKALAGLKGSTGQIIEISGAGGDGTVSSLTAVDKPAGNGATVPTKVSAFENDAGYTTEARVQELLAEFPTFQIKVVQELPAAGEEKTIYLVPFADDSGSYLEYLYVNGAWEVVGSGKDSGENVDPEQIKTAVTEYLDANGVEVDPQWAEFPRITNPALDIKNAVAMDNRVELGTTGTLRHNLMIENELITWSESNDSTDNAAGDCHVKLVCWWDKYRAGETGKAPNFNTTAPVDVFPAGANVLGVDGSVIDTVAASSDSTIIDCDNSSYIVLAICRGASGTYHMVSRTATVASNTITLGNTINVLKINGAAWDMTTLREDYTNPLSQCNTKVVKSGNTYYMAVVQSSVGIAIMQSSDGLDWSLCQHIADTDCYIEACLGLVAWTSNNFPSAYVAVRHNYGDGYITLYALKGVNGAVMGKTLIPASTGRPMLNSGMGNSNLYITYSVNGRHNAVLGKIWPRSDGTTGVSILTTPTDVMSNYPALWVREMSNGEWFILFGGTDGMNSNGCPVAVAYLWNEDNPNIAEKNKKLLNVMFGEDVSVEQAITEGTEIGSVNGVKLYAPASGGSGAWVTLGDVTTTEEQQEVEIAFAERTINRLLIFADIVGTSTNTESYTLSATFGTRSQRLLMTGAVGTSGKQRGRIWGDLTPAGAWFMGTHDAFNAGSANAPCASSYSALIKSDTAISAIKFAAGTATSYSGGTFGVGTRFLVMAQ